MPLIINGERVEDSIIRDEANAMRPRYEEMMEEMDPIAREMQLKEWSRENVIERTLLKQEAWKDPEPIPVEQIDEAVSSIEEQAGVHTKCVDPNARHEVETRMRLERLVAKVSARVARPKHKDAVEYYKKNKQQFFTPELVGAAHIVKNLDENTNEEAAREAIEQVAQKLKDGADFADLANENSDCPGNGGNLGYFPRGQMVDAFENIVFNLPVGETSDIFRSEFGFHIARVYDKVPEGARPLQEVEEQIVDTLYREKQERAMEKYIDALKAKAKVETIKGV
jgi:parvulin-like peptidyl-prolyl isomerase